MNHVLLLQHWYFRPAGGGLGEFSGGEAPDDELLALDPVRGLGCLAIEVRADNSSPHDLRLDEINIVFLQFTSHVIKRVFLICADDGTAGTGEFR